MNISVSIYRGRSKGRLVNYTIPYEKGMTVLDTFRYISTYLDATLAFRYECRQGICGTCGVMLNGIPVLSCSKQIDIKLKKQIIEPLANFPIEKDLIVDLTPILKKYLKVKPYLEKVHEVRISKSDADKSKPFRKCIECGCCIAGSKTLPGEKDVLDPMSLVKIARYVTDPRDGIDRRTIAIENGVNKYSAEEARKLTGFCPRGVPIEKAIELLKKQ